MRLPFGVSLSMGDDGELPFGKLTALLLLTIVVGFVFGLIAGGGVAIYYAIFG